MSGYGERPEGVEGAYASCGRVAKEFTKPGKRKRVSPLKGKKAPIKYRDKHGNKWSGRGMTPKWLVAAEKAGKGARHSRSRIPTPILAIDGSRDRPYPLGSNLASSGH